MLPFACISFSLLMFSLFAQPAELSWPLCAHGGDKSHPAKTARLVEGGQISPGPHPQHIPFTEASAFRGSKEMSSPHRQPQLDPQPHLLCSALEQKSHPTENLERGKNTDPGWAGSQLGGKEGREKPLPASGAGHLERWGAVSCLLQAELGCVCPAEEAGTQPEETCPCSMGPCLVHPAGTFPAGTAAGTGKGPM